MRWNEPKLFDIRQKSGFLFFIKGNKNEGYRWLEHAAWKEMFEGGIVGWNFLYWLVERDHGE